MFSGIQPVILNFPAERPIFLREYAAGTYGVLAYYLSKITIELPVTFVQVALTVVVGAALIQLQGSYIALVSLLLCVKPLLCCCFCC